MEVLLLSAYVSTLFRRKSFCFFFDAKKQVCKTPYVPPVSSCAAYILRIVFTQKDPTPLKQCF